MAKINNQEILQKLIDELELYPAKDAIPTELAEKILPVFQVNSETLEIQMKPNYILWQDLTPDDFDKSLVVPDGHTYVIKNGGMLRYNCAAIVATRYPVLVITDKAGTVIYVQEMNTQTSGNNQLIKLNPASTDIVANTGENNYPLDEIPFPAEFVLLEGWTLRFYAIGGGQATDDIEMSFIVDDQVD